MNESRRSWSDFTMSDVFPITFFGGSQDGAVMDGCEAPDVFVFRSDQGLKEIYFRENEEPPFVYVQRGYGEDESGK